MPPSGKCPACKRDTIFRHEATVPPLTGNDRPAKFHQGLKDGTLHLDRCGHDDCRSVVYRETHPGNETIMFDMYPPVDLEAAPELPEAVKKAFTEALRAHVNGLWPSAAQAARLALQYAVTSVKPKDMEEKAWRDMGLRGKIAYLASDGVRVLTPSLGQWAEDQRVTTILTVHGDEYDNHMADEQEAAEIIEFSKWIFRYLFVLPDQITKRRARLQEAQRRPSHDHPYTQPIYR